MNYGQHLIKLGYSPDLWKDESSPFSIINTWNNDKLLCPFINEQHLIDICSQIQEDINRDEIIRKRKEMFEELTDPIIFKIMRLKELGEDTTQAKQELIEAQIQIDTLYPLN